MGCALIKWLYCRMLSKLRMHKECGWYIMVSSSLTPLKTLLSFISSTVKSIYFTCPSFLWISWDPLNQKLKCQRIWNSNTWYNGSWHIFIKFIKICPERCTFVNENYSIFSSIMQTTWSPAIIPMNTCMFSEWTDGLLGNVG